MRGTILVFGVLCCTQRLAAQADTTRVTISGTVVDSDRKPLEGVDVRLVGDTTHHSTSASGTFRLYGLRGVELLLQFRLVGFNGSSSR